MRGQHPSQRLARFLAGLRLFAAQQEHRIVRPAQPRHANHALALGIVAGIAVIQ